ncbi:MAG: ketoacyl-ACP synthase III [Kiritimatiellae bacterium]|jgi:3-oxoacyl-[acyl-carrier-protein] synthase-3|nr:ketoacyl-ACP synthase III [Kiritimatiellia bacterium]
MQNLTAKITGVGKAVPETRLTNADLEKMVDTTDEWISKRVGIKERRIAQEGEYNSTFATAAAKDALKMANLDPKDIDFIIVGTTTPDTIYPSVACLVQNNIGAVNAGVLDVAAACTGFIYASSIAWGMIRSGLMKNILVIASEINTAMVDWSDRDTCILFGDGAGAAVYTASDDLNKGVLSMELGGDGSLKDLLVLPNSGSRKYTNADGTLTMRATQMTGNEVFKNAVRHMYEAALSVLAQADKTSEDVTLLIAHQANIRIIDAVSKRLKLPKEKVFVNIEKYGNTSAATIPIALAEAVENGQIKSGELLVIDAFGAGLTWGAMAIRWA